MKNVYGVDLNRDIPVHIRNTVGLEENIRWQNIYQSRIFMLNLVAWSLLGIGLLLSGLLPFIIPVLLILMSGLLFVISGYVNVNYMDWSISKSLQAEIEAVKNLKGE
jgi:hypothetical protein